MPHVDKIAVGRLQRPVWLAARRAFWALVLFPALWAGPASATVVTQSFEITAGPFVTEGAPLERLELGFILTWDPDVFVDHYQTQDILLTHTNIPAPHGLSWAGGGACCYLGIYSAPPGTLNDGYAFRVFLDHRSGISLFDADYRVPGSTSFFTQDGGVVVADVAPAPEPAAWALLMAGFGLVGAALRRSTRARLARSC